MKKVRNFFLLCWIVAVCLWLGIVLCDLQKLQTSEQVVAYFSWQMDMLAEFGRYLADAITEFCQELKYALFFGQ